MGVRMVGKLKIHEFSSEIYPRKLWVMITDNVEDVDANFHDKDGCKLDKNALTMNRAITLSTMHNESNDYGVLVVFTRKKYMTMSVIAHEAYHVVDFFVNELGMDYDSSKTNEHLAYLMGWVAQCINKVRVYGKERRSKGCDSDRREEGKAAEEVSCKAISA